MTQPALGCDLLLRFARPHIIPHEWEAHHRCRDARAGNERDLCLPGREAAEIQNAGWRELWRLLQPRCDAPSPPLRLVLGTQKP